jgi:hypothetical protein
VVLTASNVDIAYDLKVKKDVEATKFYRPKKLNNYELGNLQDECRFNVIINSVY